MNRQRADSVWANSPAETSISTGVFVMNQQPRGSVGIQMQTVNKYAAMDSSPGRADREREDTVGDLADIPTIPSPEVGAEERRHRMPVLRGRRPVQCALPCSDARFFPSCTTSFSKHTLSVH